VGLVGQTIHFALPIFLNCITELIESSDDALFNRVLCNQDHILFPLLPDERDFTYNLRKSNHNRLLTIKQGRLCSCNFITRMLFKACYWLCSISFYSRYFSLIYMYYCVIVAFCQHVLSEHDMLCYARVRAYSLPPDGILWSLKYTKFDFGWSSDAHHVGELTALLRPPIAGLQGPTSEDKGGEGRG